MREGSSAFLFWTGGITKNNGKGFHIGGSRIIKLTRLESVLDLVSAFGEGVLIVFFVCFSYQLNHLINDLLINRTLASIQKALF